MPAHIDSIAFCGMRRLHMYEQSRERAWDFGRPFHYLKNKRHWLEFTRVNVVIGPNGGGKSTFLDMIGTLSDPALLCTLPREFPIADSDTAFILQASNQVRLECQLWSTAQTQWKTVPSLRPIDQQGVFLHVYQNKVPREPAMRKAGYNVSKFDLDHETREQVRSHLELLNCIVVRWNPDVQLGTKDCAAILNEDVEYLDGVAGKNSWDALPAHMVQTKIISAREDGRLQIWLADDLLQPNNVQLSALPAGWRRYAAVIHWLQNVVLDDSICLLEEPEVHLHPRLQRRLSHRINEIATRRNLQLFVSTHAPAFMHLQAWNPTGENVALFEATGGELRLLKDGVRLLDSLGIRGSDIYQSNGVIWVEGPSDRLYIRHWMKLWCQAHDVTPPQEHVDYSFQFYGGANLAHYSGADCADFISMLRLNRRMVLVMDRDNDFSCAQDGTVTVLKPDCAKVRVWKELSTNGSQQVWITKGYTIESELNSEFVGRYFDIHGERPVPRSKSKVALAKLYADSYTDFSVALGDPAFTEVRIEALLLNINAWSH